MYSIVLEVLMKVVCEKQLLDIFLLDLGVSFIETNTWTLSQVSANSGNTDKLEDE